jgi:hypothetical protein
MYVCMGVCVYIYIHTQKYNIGDQSASYQGLDCTRTLVSRNETQDHGMNVCVCMYVCMYAYIYVYVYICIHVCIYKHIHMRKYIRITYM